MRRHDARPMHLPAHLALTLSACLALLLPACTGPGLPSGAGAAGTAQALAQTAQAGGQQAGTALAAVPATATTLAATLAAAATQAAPTVQAAATQVVGAAATAATAVAQITPPQVASGAEAEAVIKQYAQEVLGVSVTVLRAGGLTADIERQIQLPQDGDQAQAGTANMAVQTYGAVLEGGAASVSYGSGTLTGDISVDINSASLGAYAFDGGALPATEAEALALALQAFPGLANRTFTPYAVRQGYAWTAEGQVPGFEVGSRQATLIAEEILLAVTPAGPRRSAISAVVGKGAFAAEVVP